MNHTSDGEDVDVPGWGTDNVLLVSVGHAYGKHNDTLVDWYPKPVQPINSQEA